MKTQIADSLIAGLSLAGGGVISLVGAGGKTTLMFRLAAELRNNDQTVLTTTTTKILMPRPDQSAHVIISASTDEIIQRARKLLNKTKHVTVAGDVVGERKKLLGLTPEAICTLYRSGLFQWIIIEADGASQRPLKAPAEHEPVIPECTHRLIAVVGIDSVGKPLDETQVFRPHIFSKRTGLLPGQTVTPASVACILTHPKGIMKGCPDAAHQTVFLNKADDDSMVETGRDIATLLRHNPANKIRRVVIGSAADKTRPMEYYNLNLTVS